MCADGQLLLIFMAPQNNFPIDGIRYQEAETRYIIPAGSNRVRFFLPLVPTKTETLLLLQQDLEIWEAKFGFIPGSTDTSAWRVRRRYRLSKGGHPQLVLVHYGKGSAVRKWSITRCCLHPNVLTPQNESHYPYPSNAASTLLPTSSDKGTFSVRYGR